MKTNKNDYNDAEAIWEAVSRPQMHFVPIKSAESQDIQALHRVREHLVKERTALVNQVRGLLCEYGLIVGQGVHTLRRALPRRLEDAENGLTALGRELFWGLYESLADLNKRIAEHEEDFESLRKPSALPAPHQSRGHRSPDGDGYRGGRFRSRHSGTAAS